MKIIVRIILAFVIIFLALKALLPFNAYPIEHIEQFIINYSPFNWKFVAIFSRILVGLLFIIAFLLLFYWQKIKWTKYLSILMISIPFIINPVFPKDFSDHTVDVKETLPYNLKSNEKTLVIYVSPSCYHCKEAIKKLNVAKNNAKDFIDIEIISYNLKIKEFLQENNINLKLDSIAPQIFLEITKGSFPKFQLVKNNTILKKWDNTEFNYAVLDKLSNKK